MAKPQQILHLLLGLLILIAAAPSVSNAAASSSYKKSKSQSMSEASPRGGSSAVFPLSGDVYPNGMYYVTMNIGNPAKPYYLDVDTGSDLTWLQCDAPCVSCSKVPHPLYRPTKQKLVPCSDPICSALRHCETSQCDYEVQYADQGSSLGVLVSDAFTLRLANSSTVRPTLAFGCGYDQQLSNPNAPALTDGVLGLGGGKVSIMSQLKDQGVTRNVVGHCLGRNGGGFLFFGDDLVPYSKVSWAPLSRTHKYYSPGPANLYFGGKSLGIKKMDVVFDSGSSYTYFTSQPYQALVSAVKSDIGNTPLKEVSDDPSLPLCWKGQKPFKSISDAKKYFKSVVLSFVNGKKPNLEIPPENYLVVTKYGNVCLGILNGSEVGLKDFSIIGDITLQDLMVVYDNENGQIGWIKTACDRLPK
ncbi:aspartic proteinase Asp1-like isoform X3 [Carex rostrata]